MVFRSSDESDVDGSAARDVSATTHPGAQPRRLHSPAALPWARPDEEAVPSTQYRHQ